MSRTYRTAFSLIEVVVAIGIAAFCLVAVLGLFSVGFHAGLQARDQTVVAAWAGRIADEVKRTNFVFPTNKFIDQYGQVAATNEALYECLVSRSNVTATQLPGTSTNLFLVKMEFTWPASLPPAQRKNTNIVYVAIP